MNSVKKNLYGAIPRAEYIPTRLDQHLVDELEAGLIDILWSKMMMRLYRPVILMTMYEVAQEMRDAFD